MRIGALDTLIYLTRNIFERLKKFNTKQELEDNNQDFKKAGLKSVVELLKVIASLLDPSNRKHIDSVHRYVALVLFSTALETAGAELSDFISWALSINGVKHEKVLTKKSLIELPPPTSISPQNTVSISEAPDSHHLVGLRLRDGNELDILAQSESQKTDDSQKTNEITTFEHQYSAINSSNIFGPGDLVQLGLMAKDLIANDICKYTFQVFYVALIKSRA